MRKTKPLNVLLFLAGFITIAGCAPQAQELVKTPDATTTTRPFLTHFPTATLLQSPTASPARTPTVEEINTLLRSEVCSPLGGYEITDILSMVGNPYAPPPAGQDEPHQGVDIAVRDKSSGIALEGNIVQAILAGKVAGIIVDRFPYGNAVIVESNLEQVPEEILADLPQPITTPLVNPALTCPDFVGIDFNSSKGRSVYVLYAHLKELGGETDGAAIHCGQPLGVIGSTGNALNPHLHIEIRVGPGGVHLPSMAHYETSATADEMASYCTWRVSGMFQLLNPLSVLGLQP